ncbi:hypothetical protein BU24DRAFT_152752 [Aaosphaeria arxii CBS 175.79]|uniref:Secreted protein n=1 Tax=Aaosphaeria arxii CBS 175.79 TaxID=1450172 RepID=A0A6A5XXA1_9PLEO|nr:uncharacterized protein BU24DRAFT_152752 [Aaosphaeria arxii CBS 175.79]KAF2017566.1 hypothetical protein BU24DRAFT_152752 [Aaosphaeria arxii CBS 175.79]
MFLLSFALCCTSFQSPLIASLGYQPSYIRIFFRCRFYLPRKPPGVGPLVLSALAPKAAITTFSLHSNGIQAWPRLNLSSSAFCSVTCVFRSDIHLIYRNVDHPRSLRRTTRQIHCHCHPFIGLSRLSINLSFYLYQLGPFVR